MCSKFSTISALSLQPSSVTRVASLMHQLKVGQTQQMQAVYVWNGDLRFDALFKLHILNRHTPNHADILADNLIQSKQ